MYILQPPPVPPGPPAPPSPSPPAPTPAAGSKSVVAFYNGSDGDPSFWLDYDWAILTHIVSTPALRPCL